MISARIEWKLCNNSTIYTDNKFHYPFPLSCPLQLLHKLSHKLGCPGAVRSEVLLAEHWDC